MITSGKASTFRVATKFNTSLQLLPYMVSISASYVIALYLMIGQIFQYRIWASKAIHVNQCKSRVEQKCSRGDSDAAKERKKQYQTRANQRSGLDIGQVAASIERTLNSLTKGTNKHWLLTIAKSNLRGRFLGEIFFDKSLVVTV